MKSRVVVPAVYRNQLKKRNTRNDNARAEGL